MEPEARLNISPMREHLESLRSSLQSIRNTPALLDDREAILELAQTIQDLEIEAQINVKAKYCKQSCELIHHLLFTPWGAPFPMTSSLLEAAQTYKFQKHQHSDLYQIIANLIRHTAASERQIFRGLDVLIGNLTKESSKRSA